MTREHLVADCAACAALCCIHIGFEASEHFAFGKPAGERCLHLRSDDRCRIHARLAPAGFAGCAAYDCHGAGPRATRLFSGGTLTDRERHDVFALVRELHEMLWVIDGAAARCPPGQLREHLAALAAEIDERAGGGVGELLAVDLSSLRGRARELLVRVRGLVRR